MSGPEERAMSEEESQVLIEQRDEILIATLNRPQKLNALSREIMQGLEAAFLTLRETPALKVMLIRANGAYFCAGADLRNGDGGDMNIATVGSTIREAHRTRLNGMHRIYDEMEHIEKPIVVAHHGICMGGGLELSLSCDFRLAAKSAAYAFPEGKFGVLPASNGVSRLTRIVGPHWARYLIMANRRVSADKALIMGLVHDVFPDETFEEDVMAFCRDLAKQNGEQMGTAKIAIELAYDVALDQARQVERLANSALMLGADYRANFNNYTDSFGGSGKYKSDRP
jgi:enoyl-CoA hydratase/carnithine racemase